MLLLNFEKKNDTNFAPLWVMVTQAKPTEKGPMFLARLVQEKNGIPHHGHHET